MELKNAVAVCLISLFSATLVVLIARSMDQQGASRLEPHLMAIVEELRTIRSQGGIVPLSGDAAESEAIRNGLIVYYFHSNKRCPTCQAIESQSHEAVQNRFASQLERGEIVWKVLNYEQPAGASFVKKFDILMPVVVLARVKDGQIQDWKRLDEVWGLVGDKPEFLAFVNKEIQRMLDATQGPTSVVSEEKQMAMPPLPAYVPAPSPSADLPIPK